MNAGHESKTVSRLLHAVIAKSFLEILVICIVVTVAAFSYFNPLLRGAIDAADSSRITGWVVDPLDPDRAMEVQLFLNGSFSMTTRADQPREDLVRAGVAATGAHGFAFPLASLRLAPGTYAVQVYAVRQSAGASKMLLPITRQPRELRIVQ